MEFIEARYTQANVTSEAFQDIFAVSRHSFGIWTNIFTTIVAFEFVKTKLTTLIYLARFKRMKTAVEAIWKAIDQAVMIHSRHLLWLRFSSSCVLGGQPASWLTMARPTAPLCRRLSTHRLLALVLVQSYSY